MSYNLAEMNPNKLLIENYDFNRLLTKALMELFPVHERAFVEKWVNRLEEMNHSPEMLLYRAHYMWFLLLVMMRGKLTPPFTKRPPIGQLKPLHEVLPVEVYEDIINAAASSQNHKWIDRLAEQGRVHEDESKKGLFPCNFFENQPIPNEGSFCYAAVFSDFSTTPEAM